MFYSDLNYYPIKIKNFFNFISSCGIFKSDFVLFKTRILLKYVLILIELI